LFFFDPTPSNTLPEIEIVKTILTGMFRLLKLKDVLILWADYSPKVLSVFIFLSTSQTSFLYITPNIRNISSDDQFALEQHSIKKL